MNYNLLITLIENNKVNLTPLEIPEIFIPSKEPEILTNPDDLINNKKQIWINNDDSFLNKKTPEKKSAVAFATTSMQPPNPPRETITIHIDENNKPYIRNLYVKDKTLCEIMQLRDIEWRDKKTGELASEESIDYILNQLQSTGVIIEEISRFRKDWWLPRW